jgi:DNA-directed RNA polymerase subunit H (RpoH/RPB5)
MEIDIAIDNIKSMLQDRGDNIDEFVEHEVDIDREEFYNDKNITEFHTSNTTIIFALTKKLRRTILEEIKNASKGDTESFIQKFNKKNNFIIVISDDTVSSPIVQQLNTFDKILQKIGGSLQYFHIKNLLFDPTKHKLVPKHTKLSPEEISTVMEKYLIKGKNQFPYIFHSDPIARWMGLKQGDVVKIDRYNENSGISYYYRVCV